VAATQSLVSGGGNVPVGSGWRTMQDALNAGNLTLGAGGYPLSEPLLIGGDTTITALAGAVVTNTGSFQHNMLRVGNADFLDSQDAIIGISMFCADERTAYAEGTLTYTHAGTTLTWQLDGDTAGTPVSIASVTTPATGGLFSVSSGGGHTVYVKVTANAARNSTRAKRVRIEPIDGMRPVTWTRDTTTLTVTEPGHTRKVGDVVQLWGTNLRRHLYVDSVSPAAGTWTAADTRGAGSGAGGAFGVNSITCRLAGSLWDQARGVITVSNTAMCDHTMLFYCVGGLNIEAPTITRNRKYAIFLTGCSNVVGSGLRLSGDPAISNDGLHICGPSRLGDWTGVSGSAGDNLTAIGCSDLDALIWFWPTQGVIDVENWNIRNIRGEGSYFELFRIYNANSGWVRNITVDGVAGTVHGSTNAAVTLMEDSVTVGMVDNGATNIDGLTVRNISAVRANGSQMPTVSIVGAGTRRNLRFENVIPRVGGTTSAATVLLQSTVEDLYVSTREDAQAFAGAFVGLVGASARAKRLVIEGGGRMRGDNQAPVTLGTGSAATPIVLDVANAAAQVDNVEIRGVVLEDISSSGNKARLVNNGGIISKASLGNVRTTSVDSWWRQNSGSNATVDVAAVNCDFSGNFGVAADVGMTAIRETNCRVAGTAHQFSVTASFKVDAVNCVFDNTFIRGAANNPTITFTAVNCTATASLSTTGGTPVYRIGGACNLTLDGALLDATATNHAAGASFYNSNAAFGAPGVGAYVRGATAWVRVAA